MSDPAYLDDFNNLLAATKDEDGGETELPHPCWCKGENEFKSSMFRGGAKWDRTSKTDRTDWEAKDKGDIQ